MPEALDNRSATESWSQGVSTSRFGDVAATMPVQSSSVGLIEWHRLDLPDDLATLNMADRGRGVVPAEPAAAAGLAQLILELGAQPHAAVPVDREQQLRSETGPLHGHGTGTLPAARFVSSVGPSRSC